MHAIPDPSALQRQAKNAGRQGCFGNGAASQIGKGIASNPYSGKQGDSRSDQGGITMHSPRSRLSVLAALLAAAAVLLLAACPEPKTELVSSRAYSGHENDQDANNFVRAYPATVGTRLDDCQLCHSGGTVIDNTPKSVTISNACNWCHLIQWPNSSYVSGYPVAYSDTLNPFGLDYKNSGRSQEAFATIANTDSDSDLSDNATEIAANRFPGNANSKPGQPLAPTKEFTLSQITAMTAHPQFLLMNTTKQQYDDYVNYNGPAVKELLSQAGVDVNDANITSITAIAPDGFTQDFDIKAVRNNNGSGGIYYPDSVFYLVDQSAMTTDQRFVNYPNPLPTCPDTSLPYSNNDAIKDLWLTIAFQRNDGAGFADLNSSYYDSITGRLEGEGPFRIIPPQTNPGRPDRKSGVNVGDGWDYGSGLDHNAGKSTRGMCIIRINPMPSGYEAYDTSNGWSLIVDKKIVIYGYGVN
jgi:hypothetical protein